jgi:polyhydroxyalkanoate synthesis repressor PhaR
MLNRVPRRRGRPPAIPVEPGGARVIKKYGNRRLYDTRSSAYVTLRAVVELFGKEDLRVLDAVSGVDLTEKTLAQAILAEPDVPQSLLRALVRYRRGARRVDFERGLEQFLAAFEGS